MTVIRTEANVKTAETKTTRTDYRVEGAPGLQLRVTKTAKTWRLKSRKAGNHALGTWPVVSLKEARAAAAQLVGEAERAAVNKISGPVLTVRDTRTLADVLDQFGEQRGAATASWPEQRRVIENHYSEQLDAPAGKMTAEAILRPVTAGRTVVSKRAAAYVSKALRHAKTGEPQSMGVLDALVPESARTRILADAEIRAVLDARLRLDPVWRDFVTASFLLMSRRGDHAKAHASHFDLDAGIWHARIHKTKGAGVRVEAHPLSRQAIKLLTPRVAAGGHVFETRAGKPLANNFDRVLKRLQRDSGTAGWTWHDIRRTSRTLMARVGISREIAERCMSHAEGRGGHMVQVYDQYDHGAAMRHAYQALANAIDTIRAGGTIEPGQPLLRAV